MEYKITQSFTSDFNEIMESLYQKYGEEIFSIQGIANKHMDIAKFSKAFFGNSASNVAEVSVDGNANVREKNVVHYTLENNKAIMRLNSLYMMYKTVKKMFGIEDAKKALEKVIGGEIFVNDLHSFASTSYCYSFDLRNLLMNGMDFFQGNMKINPPKRSDSFIALFIQTVAYISNQIIGAEAFPSFLIDLDYFYRKDFGENYLSDPENIKKIKNQFQNIIYSLNYPFRGNQSSFTNFSIMDRGYLEGIFGEYIYPDFTKPNFDTSYELGKIFFEYFTEINGKEGIFTFPVITLAISLDDKGEYIDPEFVEWASKANAEKCLGNIFQDVPTALSSCCRLRNDITKTADAGYQNSFGVGGVSIGSHRVVGLNLPRLAFLGKDQLEEDLELTHKILLAHRKILKRLIKNGFLPLYTYNWITLTKQYSTIGILGAYEYVKNLDLDIKTQEGLDKLSQTLKYIEDKIVEWQEEEKKEKNIYNIEQIPGESMAVRLAECDYHLGFNKDTNGERNYELYSNQYLPLIDDSSIYDRLRIQGEIDSLTSGGAICHINIDDAEFGEKSMYSLMNNARKQKVKYFAVNRAFSECSSGHYSIGKPDKCPICDKNIIQYYTRTVGFITPVKAWIPTRRDYEFPKRKFYVNSEVDY